MAGVSKVWLDLTSLEIKQLWFHFHFHFFLFFYFFLLASWDLFFVLSCLFPQNSLGQGGASILNWCSVYSIFEYSLLFCFIISLIMILAVTSSNMFIVDTNSSRHIP